MVITPPLGGYSADDGQNPLSQGLVSEGVRTPPLDIAHFFCLQRHIDGAGRREQPPNVGVVVP